MPPTEPPGTNNMSSSKKPMRRTGRGLIINKNRNRKESPYISKHVITVDDEESDDISNNHHDRDYTNGEEEEDAGQGIQSSPGYLDGGILGNIGVPKDFREKIQGMSPANGQCSQLDPTVVGRRKRRRNRGNHATKGSLTLTPHAAAPYMDGQSGLLDKKKAAIPAEHSRTKEDLRNGHARHNNNNKKKKHQRGYQDILQGLQPDAKKTPKRSQGKSVRGFPGLTEQKQQSESPCSPKSNNDMQYRIPKKTQDQKLEFEVERTRGGLSGLHVSSSLQNQKKESREKHSTTDVLNLCDCSSESDSDENNTKQKPQDSSEERVTKRKRQDDDGEPNANKRRVRDGAGDYMSTVEKRTNKQKDARKRRDKKRRASTDTANFDSYKDPEKRKNAPSKAGPEKDSNKQRKDATSEKQANERAVRKSKACQLSDDSDAETVDGEQSKGIDAIDEIFNCKKKPGSAKPSTGHFGLIKKDTIESTHSESNSGAPSSNKQRKESSSDKSAASFSVSNRGAHGAKTASKPSAAIQTRLATPRATSQQTSLGFAASSQKNPLYEHQAPTSAPSKLSCAGQNAPKPWSLHGESSNSRLHEDDAGSGRRKSTGTSTDNTNKTEQSGSRLSFKKVTTEANRGTFKIGQYFVAIYSEYLETSAETFILSKSLSSLKPQEGK